MKKTVLQVLLVLMVCSLVLELPAPVQAIQDSIIINHTTIDIKKIPDQWITAIKSDTKGIDYAYTSHGAYIISGLAAWDSYDTKYAFATAKYGDIPAGTVLKIGNHNEYDYYYNYWNGPNGMANKQLSASTTVALNSGKFKYAMFEWCTEMSTFRIEQVDSYLAAMESLEAEYPNIRFIYTTGHADAGASDGGVKCQANNARIRSYSIANNKILFDYEDIGCHSPSGTDYLNNGCGIGYVNGYADECTYTGGNWCTAWKSANPSSVFTTVANYHPYEGHSTTGLQASMKSGAFWWMMARLEGWNDFGITGDLPVSGDWNNDGITEIGVYRPSTHMFYLDYNGNSAWNGGLADRSYNFG